MSGDWAWTRPLWETHFGGIGGESAVVRRMERAPFSQLFVDKMRQHFPPEAFFDMQALVPDAARPARTKLADALTVNGPDFYATLEIEGELAAMFSGCPFSQRAWRMWVTVVAPRFRRQGLYLQILEGHLGYSKSLGFDIVRSEHAVCNNAIIIAKLKSGFRLTAMEIDAEHGASAILTYFHHPEQENAYLYRSGMAVMSETMLKSGNPAMQSLAGQFGGTKT